MRSAFLGVMVLMVSSLGARAETLAEKLLAEYDGVQSVSCQIRKDTTGPAGTVRMLSRIFYQKPDRLFVENATPVKRQIVSDGTNFCSYIQGDPKGFARPVAKLDNDMAIELRKVPGTAMDHLARLRGIAESDLPATNGIPVRKGYDAGKVFVVLGLDPTGRLCRVEFYTAPDMKQKNGQYDYSQFQKASERAWIPCLHRGVFRIGDVESEEVVRVDNLELNKPIAPDNFAPGPFFKGVEFAPSFEEIYR